MKVVCTKLVNPATRLPEESSPWLSAGKEYLVIRISCTPGRSITLQIVDNSGSPSLWDSEMFQTVDGSIPSNWEAHVTGNGMLEIGPVAWLVPGFWEEFYNDERAAVRAYEKELEIIMKST